MSQMVKPYPGMIINTDVTFYPGVYDFFMQPGFVVTADNITIDANHAVFINGSRDEKINEETVMDEFGYGGQKSDVAYRGYYGVAISSKGTRNVVLKNMHAKGFLIACKLESCQQWVIEHNDFSYNYHNMDWGWDDHPIRGGIHLIDSHACTISHNKVTDVWDALVLTHSNRNKVHHNNLSHTSDTGLKLWHACENEIEDNDISWGLRKSPGEVHARDSAGVLLESGSNNNLFKRNDMTYGGDGFFIRSLNGWMSTGNVMIENDMSFANNNAIEAWSDHNTYIKNKVNHSSYGFWLGNSDHTVLIGNEVAYNGGNFHNAPEAFGNCGIAVVNGSGSHFIVKDNDIHDNVGSGLAVRFNVDYPSYHWIIENNVFANNKTKGKFIGHGIYLKNAKWMTLTDNTFEDNEGEEIYMDGHVADIQYLPGGPSEPPECILKVSSKTFVAGKTYTFDATESVIHNTKTMDIRWDFGDGHISSEAIVEKSYNAPGFYRVGLTVNDGERAAIAFMNVYVTADAKGLDTYERWSLTSDGRDTKMWHEDHIKLTETNSVGVMATEGIAHCLNYALEDTDARGLSEGSYLTFMLKFHGEATDWEDENKKPVITIMDVADRKCIYTPDFAHLRLYNAYVNEYKDNWMYFAIPLEGSKEWVCHMDEGFDMSTGKVITFDIGPHVSSYCEYYLDGVKPMRVEGNNHKNILAKKEGAMYPLVTVSSSHESSCDEGPLVTSTTFGDETLRYISASGDVQVTYTVDFGTERYLNQIEIGFYENHTGTDGAHDETLPTSYEVYGMVEDNFVQLGAYSRVEIDNNLTFDPIKLSQMKLIMYGKGKPIAIKSIEGYNTANGLSNLKHKIVSTNQSIIEVNKLGLRINKEWNETGSELGDLIVGVNAYGEGEDAYDDLYKVIIPRDQVEIRDEFLVNLPVMKLASNKTYFITLGQTNEAESRNVGSYYRWVGGGFTQNDPTYGFIIDGTFKNDPVGWGKNWLKVYTDRGVYDFSQQNENLGNRIGLKEQPIRFQNFSLSDPKKKVLTPSVDCRSGWKVQSQETEQLTIILLKTIEGNKLVLYFNEASEAVVTIKINGKNKMQCIVKSIVEWDIHVAIEELVIQIDSKNKDVYLNHVEWM